MEFMSTSNWVNKLAHAIFVFMWIDSPDPRANESSERPIDIRISYLDWKLS